MSAAARARKFLGQLSGRANAASIELQWRFTPAALLERASRAYALAQQHANATAPERIAQACQHFDAANMDRVVAICRWGSSGSLLVASNLDGHDDVVLLPGNQGGSIYPFFAAHSALSLEQKLLSYPFAAVAGYDNEHFYFDGDHPISAADYHAAVTALVAMHRELPRAFLESSRAFFVLLHVAYAVALGRLPVGTCPLMVYAQALPNDRLAAMLVGDFPQARFIHTVRDPITNVDRIFEHDLKPHGLLAPLYVIARLTLGDKAQQGMEERTRAVRFEDLHLRTEAVMRALAAWVGIAYQPCLLESTWNGSSYTWKPRTGAQGWSGARPDQAKRTSKNVSATDRALLYVVFNEDFVRWGYPCPALLRSALLRVLTCLLLVLIPTKMEWVTAKRAVRAGSARGVVRGLAQLLVARAALVPLFILDLSRRLASRKRILTLLPLDPSTRTDVTATPQQLTV